MKTVLLTGGTGFIGGALRDALRAGGTRVIQLSRRSSNDPDSTVWDPNTAAFDLDTPIDAVVHLAGENIVAGRWNAARKARIRESRVAATAALVRRISALQPPPRVFLCASAIGFYGDRGAEQLDERSAPGDGFLADLCREWEQAAAQGPGRTVQARIGIVLHPSGGALKKMLPAFRLCAGGRLGEGSQYLSWISRDDAVAALLFLLENDSIRGPVNVVAPHPVTNREYTAALGKALRRPAVFPVPKVALRLLFGEMADAALLASQRVMPRRLLEAGFQFRDPEIGAALRRML